MLFCVLLENAGKQLMRENEGKEGKKLLLFHNERVQVRYGRAL